MTQYVINIGAVPDDGTGDPLRTAFNETNLNFDQVFAAGPVLSNIQIANNKILTTNTNGNLVLAPNGTGVVQSNVSIVPNAANIRNLGSATNRWNTVYAQYLDVSANLNITGNIIYNGDLNVSGNLTVQGNIIQVGNIVTETLTIQLANAASTANAANGSGITVGANDDIATLLYNSTGNTWTTNIGLSSVGNITAPYFFGNGSQLTGLAATYGNANVVANLAALGSNPISTTGNITGGYLFGNGSQLTGLPAGYANANVVAYGESGWAGNIVPSGNAVYSLGNATNQWNDLYVSNATIFMNNVPISLSAGNVLTVNSEDVVVASNTGLVSVSSIDIGTTNFLVGDDDYLVFEGLVPGGIRPAETDTYNLGNVGKIWSEIHANVYYGNGSQLTGISTANTGNVTFNDVNIIGTGNLNLQPNDASSEYLNIYLTGAADIHVAYGGGSGNVILGTDEEANIAVLQGGNVAIQAGNVSGTKTWTFDTSGNLTLPLGGVVYETNIPDGALSGSAIALTPPGGTNADQQLLIYPTTTDANHLHLTSGNLYNTELFLGSDDLYVKLANTGAVVINSNDGVGNTAQWNFSTDGNLTTPGGMIINGNINTLGAQTALLQPTDDLPLSFIASGANGTVTSYWAEDIANLMSSNIAAVYTPLQNTQTVRIVTGTNGGNIAIYDFDKDGVFSTAQVSATGNVTGNYFIGNGSLLTGISASLPVTNGTSNFDIATANGNATITANSASTWTFGTDSALTLPASSGQIGRSGYPNGIDLYNNNGGTGYVRMNYADESLISADSGGAHVQTTGGTWDFDTTGNLTAPGNVSAVGNIIGGNIVTSGNITTTGSGGDITMSGGNITGAGNISAGNLIATGNIVLTGSLVGSGASPAPSINGFSSVSAVTLSASGNVTAGNVNTGVITLTNGAVIKDNAGDSVAFGQSAGGTSQGNSAVALGQNAGATGQGTFTVAIGRNAGQTTQGGAAVAIGVSAGDTSQGNSAVAIGSSAGFTNQSANTVAVGVGAGQSSQGVDAVAIGASAGSLTQGIAAVAIGTLAGRTFQANNSIIINATGANLDQTTANTFTVAPVRNDVANVAEVMFYNTTSKEITYGNVISVTGNVTAANFFGNGNTLSNVATTFESTWTVPVGNSTQSFTVTPNNTYYMWVDCNIPNGILTWNATATVTNTNVPVVGAQYAWVYDGGGTPIDFTSIPNQFVGTSNTIVRSSVSPSATTNRFDFGINNASGNTVTVNYGYTKIS